MIQLRPFQADTKNDLYKSWANGSGASIVVLPTGAGKTVLMSSVAVDVQEITVAMAHRQELVQQISMAMAQMGLRHNIIAPAATINVIISQHIRAFGQSFYNRRAALTVAGVNTLNRRAKELTQWANTVRYWMGDECHHFQASNMWGKAVAMFPNARGVGFTATPIRCDHKSLQFGHGGVFDDMVVGPGMRELIKMGYLSDYRIFGPPQSIDISAVKISNATGDFTHKSLSDVAAKSTITGDVVAHYMKIAPGKRGITFTVDVEAAMKTAELFRSAGVSAEAVSAKTPDNVRNEIIQKFRKGIITQLVNVDLFGEGFDVPAVEVVSMARPTQSFGLYTQQFGRALRMFENKSHGIVIDHVGNVKRHGLPDAVRNWTLTASSTGRRSMVKDPDVMPTTTCLNLECLAVFEAITSKCPYCLTVQEPEARSEPKFVDGDLIEFSPELLAKLRGDIEKIDRDFDAQTMVPGALQNTPAQTRLVHIHGHNQLAQKELRENITYWAGIRRDKGQPDSEIYRRFYHTFGTDIMSAQGLKAKPANDLCENIKKGFWKL